MTLRELRDSQAMTQVELARRVGLTPAHVSHFETGARIPARDLAMALAAALGVADAVLSAAIDATPKRRRVKITPRPRACAPCGRLLIQDIRVHDGPRPVLSPPDYCGSCARPLTEAAIRRQPTEGFIELVRTLAREPASVRRSRLAEVDA